MPSEIVISGDLTLAQLYELRRIEIVLHYEKLTHRAAHRLVLDADLARALQAHLIEIVVSDDYQARTKTLTVYPYGESPPEDAWRLIRRDSATDI